MWVLSHWYTDCYNNVMKTEREDTSSGVLSHSGCSSTSKLINSEVGTYIPYGMYKIYYIHTHVQ